MSELVDRLGPHLVVAPVLVPVLAAAVMLLLGEGRRRLKVALGLVSMLAGLAASVALLARVSAQGPLTYVPGAWPAEVGIAVVADRLAALMLVVTWTLAPAALVFAAARWQRAGVHFHPLLQLELVGLSGAFLAGDLFNLFVFFELLLAASYGLLLHGAGRSRIVSGLHYVAVNLAASSLFLVGATMLYGITGTLNLAAVSEHLARVAPADRGLLQAGAAILAVAFLAKAAAWPLGSWLVPAYSAATPPVAALFAILTEVGVYALLRTSTLLRSGGAETSLGGDALLVIGCVTAAIAALGMVGAQRLAHQAALSVVVSAGTLLAAVGLGVEAVTGGALFYLVSSVLSGSALFLVGDVVERWRNSGATLVEPAPWLTAALREEDVNLDDEEAPLVGVPFPASTAFLALAFLGCALLVSGLPPLSSFVGKLAMLAGALAARPGAGGVSGRALALLGVVIGTGFLTLVALARLGIRTFWSARAREPARIALAEGLPIAALLAACLGLTVAAGPVLRLTLETARALHAPGEYVRAVLGSGAAAPPGRGGAP